MEEEPKLVKRRLNHHSTMKSGRTIGEKREKIETSNERMAAHKQAKRQKRARVFFVSTCFLILIAILIVTYFLFFEKKEEVFVQPNNTTTYEPTIEVIDENTADSGITSRMNEYIGQAEADFHDLGYQPIKAVLPSGSIREVDFYLDGYSGYIKTVVDRGAAVSVEDADRMIRYLTSQGIMEFKYIDVRVSGKAFWQ